MKNCIIASTSALHGQKTLEYLLEPLRALWKDADEIIFIPYARPGGISHTDYTARIESALSPLDKAVIGLHTVQNPGKTLAKAKAIYTGGGNTFVLVNALYQQDLMADLKEVIQKGTPYLGTSAGSNICGLTMQTTNDMPVASVPNYRTLGILPFNINPHYQDPDPTSTHKGETRETRIKEYHTYNSPPVVGLREGSWLQYENENLQLKGTLSARIFKKEVPPYELSPGSSLNDIN